MQTLNQVTDRFSLFRDGRQLGANRRKYIVKAVQDMINAPRTQELIRLGEAYGFYGHQPRQRANKLSIGETEVINIKGKPVVVENIPSNRTLKISCDDHGVVSHTQEFLDTDTGRIASGLHKSRAGGWSWATGGQDTPQAAITTSYHGMDYVLQPNFISLDHPSMMMESAGREAMLLESLQGEGFELEDAQNIINSMSNPQFISAGEELENQVMYLEGINSELRESVDIARAMLLEAAESMPFYMTDEQRSAINSMSTEHDRKVVKAMFESLGSSLGKLQSLPTNQFTPVHKNQVPRQQAKHQNQMIDFAGRRLFD